MQSASSLLKPSFMLQGYFSRSSYLIRSFNSSGIYLQKPLPPRPKINDADITESFLKGTGPGGQKINKTSSAVQLIHHPTGIVVKVQDTRSRSQNRSIARKRLAEAIEVRELGSASRVSIKAAEVSRKKASASKKSRRKYRALEDQKVAEAAACESEKGTSTQDEPKGPMVGTAGQASVPDQ